ncbi:MAG: type II secretion system F family protein [Planctomycetaceae bacterium]
MNPHTMQPTQTRSSHTSELTTGPSFPLPEDVAAEQDVIRFDEAFQPDRGIFGEATPAMAAATPTSHSRREDEIRLLRQAGHLARSAYIDFAAIRYAMTIGCILILGTAMLVVSPRWEPFVLGGLVTLPFLFWLIPASFVERQARTRNDQIASGIPDFMSLIKLYVQQGMDLPTAFARAGTDLKDSYPAIAVETAIANAEAEVLGFPQAMQNFCDRLEVPDLNILGSMLVHSAELGSSVCDSLDKNSQVLRTLRAEKRSTRAKQTPAKIIVPTLFFLLPSAIFVFYAPSIVDYLAALDTAIINSNFAR